MRQNSTPYIYLILLSSCKDNQLHGCWIDSTESEKIINEKIQKMLSESPVSDSRKWKIHVYDGFGSLKISKHESIDDIFEMAKFIVKHGKLGVELINCYDDLDLAIDAIENNYLGEWNNETDFAIDLINNLYSNADIPKLIRNHINYQSIAHDLFISDYMSFSIDRIVHVFHSF